MFVPSPAHLALMPSSIIGDHALYECFLRLFPDIEFQLHPIEVNGSPWNTIARIEWSETNTGTDGIRTRNEYQCGRDPLGQGVPGSYLHRHRRLTQTLNRLAIVGNAEAS